MAIFFLGWEFCTRLEIINPFYFPPISKILVKGYEMFAAGAIWEHMWFSLTNFSIGFVISVILGVIIGVPMGWYRAVHKAFDPLLSGIYATPLIALIVTQVADTGGLTVTEQLTVPLLPQLSVIVTV